MALWASSQEVWGARCEEGGVGHVLEGSAACVAEVGPEDAAVASDRAVHRADPRRESADSQEEQQGADMEVHWPDCLEECT